VGRVVLVGWLLLTVSVVCSANPAMAASDVQLEHAPDGTLVVVGSGWPSGQELLVSLGDHRFEVQVDPGGEFEVPTGLASYQGSLAVHHLGAAQLALMPLVAEPHPLAVLFAHALAQGFILLTFVVGVAMVGTGVARRWRFGRYPRR
jgi:hypothetical protein